MDSPSSATQSKPVSGAVPSPPGLPLLGNLPDVLRRDQHALYVEWCKNHGDLLKIQLPFGAGWYFLGHPDHVGQMLLGSHSTYAKGIFWNRVKVLMGEGLLTSDGAKWREQRRQLQPAFKASHHGEFFAAMLENTSAMIARWKEFETDKPFDITQEMMRVTLLNAGRTLFGSDFTPDVDAMCHDMSACVKRVNSSNFWKHWTFDPAFLAARKRLHGAIDKMLQKRRVLLEKGELPDDMLGALMAARDEAGKPLSEAELHDEVMTFLFTGQETTALALTWMWFLLAKHPEVLGRVRAEVECVFGEEAPRMDELSRLEYSRRMFQEVTRLYPPVWGIARQTTEPVEIGGYSIPSGSILVSLPYVTHRHPDFWPEPERFDPDRFLPQQVQERHKYAYFAFGGGPRLCIGQHFAMMEAMLVLTLVARHFDLQMPARQNVEPALWATLRPRHGLQMQARSRPVNQGALAPVSS